MFCWRGGFSIKVSYPKMLQTTDNMRKELLKLVPSSTATEISCFSFYDKHPRNDKKLDIIVCTTRGEIKEYFLRDLVSSVFIGVKASDITLFRNSKCELFYIVTGKDEIFVLSRKDQIEVMHHLKNIEKYVIEDPMCFGQPFLKVIRKDDAVPLHFDENLQNLSEQAISFNQITSDDSIPLVNQLMRKLTEAKYLVKCNDKAYQELVKLRQQASFSEHQKVTDAPLTLKNTKPNVKCCNGTVVIILEVQSKSCLQDVHILLHCSTSPSITYTSKLYSRIPEAPYWQQTKYIQKDTQTNIVCTIDLDELKHNTTKRIEFNGVISYKIDEKQYLLPFENVSISALDVMGEEFDVLYKISHSTLEENLPIILAIIATSDEINLSARYIRKDDETTFNFTDLLCQYLQMEKVSNANIVLHKISPFHILHGVMIVVGKSESDVTHIIAYTRHQSQILALLNYINDAIPYRIVITSSNHIMTPKHNHLSQYKEEPPQTKHINQTNYENYGFSVLQQSSAILEYLDNCMVKMNESKNPVVLNKVGHEIDVFADGLDSYKEFKENIFQEARRGIMSILEKTTTDTTQDNEEYAEGMIIDSD